jgi:NAD(P)-dependent dehydrogenase (short-subunit alcohol dehydrogenase family)
MHIDLSTRHAVISGSTAGIGLAIARGLAAAGAHVVVTGRTQKRVDEAIDSIRKQVVDAKLSGVAGDLGTREGADALIAAVPQTDILVNNLGIFEPKGFFDIPDEDWQNFFEVNVMSGIRLARHYAKGMAERGWGRVQFVSSESGVHAGGHRRNGERNPAWTDPLRRGQRLHRQDRRRSRRFGRTSGEGVYRDRAPQFVDQAAVHGR